MNNNAFALSALKPLLLALLGGLLLSPGDALARKSGDSTQLKRYIVELLDPPLAAYEGGELSAPAASGLSRLSPTAPSVTGELKLNVASLESQSYMAYLASRHEEFVAEATALLGREIKIPYRYRTATNGMAIDISESEAALLSRSPLIRSIVPDYKLQIETYAGPPWIGAESIWYGDAGVQARGEGVLVGVIDTGINWDHPSFEDPAGDGYKHINPFGGYLGLCDLVEVNCNDKLVGVYDFVTDDPATEDVVEENTNGKDNHNHGSHTASTAAGNPVNVFVNNAINSQVSGVAPRANIISYRVCYQGEPASADAAACDSSATLQAIGQAITDGVDVINYSVGGSPRDPWTFGSVDRAFLNARNAGIYTASSAGNAGPDPGTVGSPANAPWVTAVGNATHNTLPGSAIQNMTGGNTAPPGDIVGASLTGGTGKLVIVHAKDYGNALCGEGPAESQPTCAGNTGASSPWGNEKVFNGEIVVCDRGTYGRVEKGKNVLLAGAGGYVLANTAASVAELGDTIVADDHCLPGVHIEKEDGDELRAWLDGGSGHGASLSGLMLAENDGIADLIRSSSSRGPVGPPVADTLKPNVIAPGTFILAASAFGSNFVELNGTSMSSPHVAGAAALLKSARPGWTPSQLASAIETTATDELAKDFDGSPATTQQAGAGRPQLGDAVNTGLYLDATFSEFTAANPAAGGDPKSLNLPGLVDASCKTECSFTRTLTDQAGGANWTAQPVGFPAGTQVTVSPASFNLASGASRDLTVTVNVGSSGVFNDWVSGKVRLSAPGLPDQYLTVSAYSNGGELPAEWVLTDDRNGGWHMMNLSDLVSLPEATFTTGGLVPVDRLVESLPEDPSNDTAYDGGEGIITRWYDLPDGALWLYAETPASTAEDIDLFVGRDEDGNGIASSWEELCSSTTPEDLERCDLYDLPPGNYFIIAQNWTASEAGSDEVTLLSAAIEPGDEDSLAASGPGITSEDETFAVRLSWDNLKALPGETWLGAVGVGSNSEDKNNIGVIPVRFVRESTPQAIETFPLMNGRSHALALAANSKHDRVFIDVPPGASSLTVSAAGAEEDQTENLTLELVRMDYSAALANPPFTAPASGAVIATATGVNDTGPEITINNPTVGRWYAVLSNGAAAPAAIDVRADVAFNSAPFDPHPGLWSPSSRPNLGQGYDFNRGGSSQALIWYTYDENGQPTWYIAGGPASDNNIWVSDVLRVTNDGTDQQLAPVGALSITQLSASDALFSFTLFGHSGTDRMMPLSGLTCPSTGSQTGIWFKGVEGLGGASVLMNASTQAQIHYLFDDVGMPRWLFAQDLDNPAPTNSEVPMLQFSGYCAVCDSGTVSNEAVGVLARSFSSETAGSWTLDYLFKAPLSGSVERTDSIVKLTDTLPCQ